MKVLLTGHRGYLGTILSDELARRNHRVTGLDTDLFHDSLFRAGPDYPQAACFSTIRKDVRDIELADLRGFEAVIHLAGLSNDPLGDLDPEITYQINHHASVRLARLARQAGVERMVLASSCSVYGASDGDLLTETSPYEPVTPYAVSKLRLEQDIQALADDSFSPVFLRSGTVYGATPKIRFDLVVNNLVAWGCSTGKVLLKSDGSAWRPVVHARDIVRCFAAMLELDREKIHGEAFNLVRTRDNFRVIEIADQVAARIPGCEVAMQPGANADKRNYRVSGEKIEALLGADFWQHDLASGIDELVTALRQFPVSPVDFEGPRYQRLAHLRQRIRAGVLDDELRQRTVAPERVPEAISILQCRVCGHAPLQATVNFGPMPLADRLVPPQGLQQKDPRFPLALARCPGCTLVQLTAAPPPGFLFDAGFPYYSSVSSSFSAHANEFADRIIADRSLDESALVIEIGSNDGYLLRHFNKAGIPVMGIDPVPGPVEKARSLGIPCIDDFFDAAMAAALVRQGRQADLIVGNNVLAHVPDPNDLAEGVALLLKPDGMASFEVPYLVDLVDKGSFDTIYHEHHCYFSLQSLVTLFARHGLRLFDVERLAVHGGSLRISVCHENNRRDHDRATVRALLAGEHDRGVGDANYLQGFGDRVSRLLDQLREQLLGLKAGGYRVAAYGAAAKGTMLLNAAGLDGSVVDFVVDLNPVKQYQYVPGVRIPILPPEALIEKQVDYVLLLAWNIAEEIIEQQQPFLDAGGRFIIPLPTPVVYPALDCPDTPGRLPTVPT